MIQNSDFSALYTLHVYKKLQTDQKIFLKYNYHGTCTYTQVWLYTYVYIVCSHSKNDNVTLTKTFVT